MRTSRHRHSCRPSTSTYIRAMVKELFRWRPIAPIRHIESSRTTDEGMFIPKGTLCLANACHMNRDPEIFGKNDWNGEDRRE